MLARLVFDCQDFYTEHMTTDKKALLALLARAAKKPADLDSALADLLTPKEYHDLIERYLICSELHKGKTVKDVCDKLGVASATVVRGNRVLKYGTGTVKKLLK